MNEFQKFVDDWIGKNYYISAKDAAVRILEAWSKRSESVQLKRDADAGMPCNCEPICPRHGREHK